MSSPLGYDNPRERGHDEYRDLTVFLEAVEDGEEEAEVADTIACCNFVVGLILQFAS